VPIYIPKSTPYEIIDVVEDFIDRERSTDEEII
jgi:hypothetical protein